MKKDDDSVMQLAHILGLPPEVLVRHLIRPLPLPMAILPQGWGVPDLSKQIFAITDGFRLFGKEPWNGFKFWDYQEYDECCEQVHQQAVKSGLFPFFGDIPHLTSISLVNGSVVSSDWEDYMKPERGWGEVIAPSLQDFFRTLVHVRELYGYDDDNAADWWSPYASHGSRYDSEK